MLILSTETLLSQNVFYIDMEENIEGMCNEKVFALLPIYDNHEVAVCPLQKNEIIKKLNDEITFIENNPKFKDKGNVSIIINCKGEVIQCIMEKNTKDSELDKQIIEVFNSLGNWKPGKINGIEVDSYNSFSFKIKKGKFELAY